MLKPKLFTTLQDYSKEKFLSDLSAGVIVGIIALPLAIAFAIASGVSPEKGLITAIFGGFIISALGGSRVQIGGPTGAFVVIVYSVIQNYGLNGLIISTVMAGIILVIMGLARFGSIIKFIPHPVVVGFTSGIALIILTSQIKDILGLQIENLPSGFIEKWEVFFQEFQTINYYSLGITIGALIIMIIWHKVSKKIPGSLAAIILSTLAVSWFHLPVETIGSRFGEITASIPPPSLFQIDLVTIKNLIQPATTIAILAAIESLLSAVVADGMVGGKHRSNMELVAQGVANIITPIFGGIPATGAIARTATNIKNGGRTPIAGIIHAITLLFLMLFLGGLASMIPLASLAAVLVIVAYNMSEWRTFISVLKSPRSDVAVLLTTFGLTIIFDLTIAIQIGMILAVFLFMRRMAMVSNVGIVTRELKDDEESVDLLSIDKRNVPEGVEVFEINGPFFFGAVEKFKEAMNIIETAPKIRIIRMRNVPAIDSTGLHVIEEVLKSSKKAGTKIIFSGVHAQPLMAFDNSGLLKKIGEENLFANIDDALNRANEILNEKNLTHAV
jgi:SulP family sulfate permease